MKTEFDQADYDALLKYYYEPIVQHNVELPGGRTLRRQTSPPRIEQDTLGFNALRKTINGLKKSSAPDSHNKIYQLLRELNAWQTRPPSLGGSLPSWQRGLAEESAVTETVDLTAEETVIDVDTYIIDVLLVGVLQPKPDPDGGAPRMVAVSKPALFVKREADDELAARPMQPKKRKASAAWEEECAALIANGDRDAVSAIAAKLKTLQRSAEARLIDLIAASKPPTPFCRVLLIKSNQEQDEEYEGYDMRVSAEFTAGPQAARFSISFYCKDVGRVAFRLQGHLTIAVESDLFTYKQDEHGDESISDFDDDAIESFLRDAGLSEALPQRCPGKWYDVDNLSDEERRRWVYGDVIYDAVGLVQEKHGFRENYPPCHGFRGCGMSLLGMDKQNIYWWLGLEY